jgi:N-acetylglucosamine-6-phosphate deacetylase
LTPDGFVDLHTHGIGRYDTRTGNPSDVLRIARLHASAGTVSVVLAIYPGTIREMRGSMEAVRRAMEMQTARTEAPGSSAALSQPGARILGVHLEGPFLNPVRCGALDKRSFLRPGLPYLRELIEGYEDIIKIITVAPEIPGALKVIERCRASGIRVNMGHSDATYKEALKGKQAGATGVTHLFNAMRPFHHREPGLAGLGLIDEDLYVEVIADLFHLHPMTLELVFSRKRLDRIILVSDSVKNAGRRGRPSYQKGVLAGSGITVADALKVLEAIGVPEGEITEAAIDNPARYLA